MGARALRHPEPHNRRLTAAVVPNVSSILPLRGRAVRLPCAFTPIGSGSPFRCNQRREAESLVFPQEKPAFTL